MIVDKLENIRMYSSLLPHLEAGLAAAEAADKSVPGRYEFDGGFFLIQKGETKPMKEGNFEAHRKYIDVQIVTGGSEEFAWADIRDLDPAGEYDEEKDKAMYSGTAEHTMKAVAGMCYIAFPHDGHKAVRHTGAQQSFTKIVMKLSI